MSIESAVIAKAQYILAQERANEWQIFRESLQDPSLLKTPADIFFINMRAAYLQLLGGAMMKSLGGPVVLTKNPTLVMKLYDVLHDSISISEQSELLDELKGIYNIAYGSSSSNGIGAMVHEFDKIVSGGHMSSRASGILVEHFTAVWVSMINEFSSVVDNHAIVSKRGVGCMLTVLSVLGATFCAALVVHMASR